jgi:hypothetical protein
VHTDRPTDRLTNRVCGQRDKGKEKIAGRIARYDSSHARARARTHALLHSRYRTTWPDHEERAHSSLHLTRPDSTLGVSAQRRSLFALRREDLTKQSGWPDSTGGFDTLKAGSGCFLRCMYEPVRSRLFSNKNHRFALLCKVGDEEWWVD